ncbi:MAG: hypothetical protein M3478_10715 [Planctomycetota bacterium]|nr:hypothetical protein [Planctomycetota bacterium]
MEQPPMTASRDLTRPFTILGVCLIFSGAIMALGFWLAFDRAMGRFERAVDAHAVSVRESGRTIASPQIRVVEPMPIKEPVKIRGIKDDGAMPIEAKVAK